MQPGSNDGILHAKVDVEEELAAKLAAKEVLASHAEHVERARYECDLLFEAPPLNEVPPLSATSRATSTLTPHVAHYLLSQPTTHTLSYFDINCGLH